MDVASTTLAQVLSLTARIVKPHFVVFFMALAWDILFSSKKALKHFNAKQTYVFRHLANYKLLRTFHILETN